MVDLCAAKGIFPETQVVPVAELNRVMELLAAGNDTGLRYVLDISVRTLAHAHATAARHCPALPARRVADAQPYARGLRSRRAARTSQGSLNESAFAACADVPAPKFASHEPSSASKAQAMLKAALPQLAVLALGVIAGIALRR